MLLTADWQVMGGVLKIARRIWQVGVAGSPVIGCRRGHSQHYWRPGLRASSDGVLATKSERKMLASTCLYSLYAWLNTAIRYQVLDYIYVYSIKFLRSKKLDWHSSSDVCHV